MAESANPPGGERSERENWTLDNPEWSNWTIDGERQTWRQMYEREHALLQEAARWHVMASDLDRCEHGRHEGDVCSSCGGPSKGNPHLTAGSVVGYSLSAKPYVVPPPRRTHDFEAWTEQSDYST